MSKCASAAKIANTYTNVGRILSKSRLNVYHDEMLSYSDCIANSDKLAFVLFFNNSIFATRFYNCWTIKYTENVSIMATYSRQTEIISLKTFYLSKPTNMTIAEMQQNCSLRDENYKITAISRVNHVPLCGWQNI